MVQEKTILVVDDDPFYIDFFKQLFKKSDYSILSSNDGHYAYEIYQTRQPDLVITDIFMLSNGIELLTKIKSDNKATPVIIISGGLGKDKGYETLEMAKGLGADACFHKPIEPKDMVDSVDSLLNS